jgi:ribosomal protein S18 acetylase RimI-like enzyme
LEKILVKKSDFTMIEISYLPVERWREYKSLKLFALDTEKFAFSKRYCEEKNISPKVWKSRLKSNSVVFAFDNDELIGMVAFVFSSAKVNQGIAQIFSVYVIPDMRKKGVAKKLFNFILKEAKKLRIKKIELSVFENNLPAKNFYLSCGFKIIGRNENKFLVEGKYYNEIMMEKLL